MMTEAEAKTKFCPLTRTVIAGSRVAMGGPSASPAFNVLEDAGSGEIIYRVRCIGSACMAFRWAPDATIILKDGAVALVDRDDAALADDRSYARLNLGRRENSGRRGYCGAFGNPR